MSLPLPAALIEAVQSALREHGDGADIRSARRVAGGCINNAVRLETEKRAYLLKWNPQAAPGFFQQEIRGLRLLAATHTVRVPDVIAASGGAEEGGSGAEADELPAQPAPAFLLLEWLEPGGPPDAARLGEQLAALHRHDRIPDGLSGFNAPPRPAYGLDHDNLLGSTSQVNAWMDDWGEFFVTCRLLPQVRLAAHNGRLPAPRRASLERVIARAPELLRASQHQPSLIHGDLWSGNVIPGPDGLALIDPAVSFSDREAELAYTELFGGFSPRFYAAYQQSWPLDRGYAQRRDLYNLYHLLNHLNLFGETYGPAVDAIARRYG